MATEPILSVDYWRERLKDAKLSGHLHHAVFRCPIDRWEAIEAQHRRILDHYVKSKDSILDVGCGYGRLLELLPPEWRGFYLGIDISPDLLNLAKREHPSRCFHLLDVVNQDLGLPPKMADWAVCISFRPMIRRNLGDEAWDRVQAKLNKVARATLFLEYDEHDEGEVLVHES